MRNLYAALIATMLASAGLPSWSQPGPPASAASMPRQGSGPTHGGPQGHWGRDYTPGWSMMSEAERKDHRERMQGFKSYEECKAYMDKHHEEMAARAKERGARPLPKPRRDACAGFKK
ncbi:hypothetical protein [Azohydromonas aeria]|uniref:hypothetical protein n=1 Tax=Azohydromonas aeria TaxID=2590212 RepID=UPI0012FB1F1D|nr:hypothetical protein [Azohydromonas aeria]